MKNGLQMILHDSIRFLNEKERDMQDTLEQKRRKIALWGYKFGFLCGMPVGITLAILLTALLEMAG